MGSRPPHTVTPNRTAKPNDTRVFAMADRLLADFDHLPVGTVLRAIAGAHTTLRERGIPSDPDEIEELVRRVLHPGRRSGP